jgi:carbon-monoxide dehydrogenase medium subunit
MRPFELLEPRSLSEALVLLDAADETVRPSGGGTALMLMMKAGVLEPSRLISLRRIEPACAEISQSAETVEIGALATLSAIEHSALVRSELPVIARTLRTLANVRVRNVATLGGNLAHADPHMDLPPVLIALGASVIIASRGAERELPVAELISGYYETTLASGELIVRVRVPKQFARFSAYRKITTRSADDWPALGVAVALDRDGPVLREARIAVSAAFDRPLRLSAAESVLRGASIDDEAVLIHAGDAAADEARPIADERGSAAYKRELIRVHVRRALRDALDAQGGKP